MARKAVKLETKYQMLRLPVDLLEALEAAGKASARSVPKEAEFRLRESLTRNGASPAMSPWARSASEVFGRLAAEIDEIGTGTEVRFGMFSQAAITLLMQLRPADTKLNKDDENMVRTLVAYLVQKLKRDHVGILEGLSEE
jgi:hypothetical protein